MAGRGRSVTGIIEIVEIGQAGNAFQDIGRCIIFWQEKLTSAAGMLYDEMGLICRAWRTEKKSSVNLHRLKRIILVGVDDEGVTAAGRVTADG